MRKSILCLAATLAFAVAQFSAVSVRAETTAAAQPDTLEPVRQNLEATIRQLEQEAAEIEILLENRHNRMREIAGENPEAAPLLEAWEREFLRLTLDVEGVILVPEIFNQPTFLPAESNVLRFLIQRLSNLRAAITGIRQTLADPDTSSAGTRSAGQTEDSRFGTRSTSEQRIQLEEQQSHLQQRQHAQTALVAAFTPTFLTRRRTFLAELPADMRANLENGGSNDWAGRASVTYTAMKIYIALQAAANEGRKIPKALVALNNLYRQMSGYYSAVLETEVQIAQVQKNIAHTIVDEKDYAMGGGDGGDGGGGEGGNGGGN